MQAAQSPSDASLVTAALEGCAQSFRQIVERYQTLVCSLTYSGTGSLNQSEELAQETFLLAWKQLRQLRDPQKLRSCDRLSRTNPALHTGLVATLFLLHIGFLLPLTVWGRNQLRAMRHTANPQDAPPTSASGHSVSRRIDYRSKWTLLGLPLVHIRFGENYAREFGLARGWIALGDTAVDILLAAGAVAWGWLGAWGAIALSETYAVGTQAFAPHANDEIAHTFFATGFANVITGLLHHGYLLAALALWPVILAWRETRLLPEQPHPPNQPPSAPSPDPSSDPEQNRRRRRLWLLVPLCALSVVV